MSRLFACLLPLLTLCSSVLAQGPEYIVPLNVEVLGTPAPGYFFLTPFNLDSAGDYASGLLMLDSAGTPLVYEPNTLESVPQFTRQRWADLTLQPNGDLTLFYRLPDGRDVLSIRNNSLVQTDTVVCGQSLDVDAHEAILEPNGTMHLFCLEERIMDASAILTNTGLPGSDSCVVLGNNIQRLDASGNVLWQWHSLDHFDLTDTYSEYFMNPANLDHTHVNSLEIDADGNYLMSSRHLNEVTKINSTTGDVMWRMGGKQNEFTLVGDTTWFTGMHDARRLPNGNISLFDNATTTPNGVARAIEYEVDEVNMTATVVWQRALASGHSSRFIGNAQRMANGNTVINWGGALPLNETLTMEEVDSTGNTVLRMDMDGNFISYRIRKFELPFALPQPDLWCMGWQVGTNTTGDAYRWNTGETTQSITMPDTGSYYVWTQQGDAWFRSESLHLTDTAGCPTVSSPTIAAPAADWLVFPNPATWELTVSSANAPIEQVQLHDVTGQQLPIPVVRQQAQRARLDVSTVPAGVYFLTVNGSTRQVVIE